MLNSKEGELLGRSEEVRQGECSILREWSPHPFESSRYWGMTNVCGYGNSSRRGLEEEMEVQADS